MKTSIIIILIFLSAGLSAQVLSLDTCLNLAEKNYPLIAKRDLLEESVEIRNKINDISYYPSLVLNGQATLQSDVVHLEIDNPMFADLLGEVSKDQYKVYAEFNQTIWDGGVISSKKELETAGLQTELQKIEVDLFTYKGQLVNLFYAALTLQKQLEILDMNRWKLANVISDMRVAVDNDVMLQSQLDILLAEDMILDQKFIEIEYEIKSLIKMLSKYCGAEFSEDLVFLVPTPEVSLEGPMLRPELQFFTLQSQQISASKDLIKSTRMPKMFAFAQAGYGRPGLNMLSNEFEPYAIVGAKFVWTPFDWNKAKKEMSYLDVQANIVNTSQETFLIHQNSKLESQSQKIEKIKLLANKDEDILELREGITKSYLSQLNNGVIKSSDYLNVLNEENSQRLKNELHELMLSEAVVKYNLLKGELYSNNK